MFELTQAQLKTLHGDGGEPFRGFVNDLLLAEAFTCGVALRHLDLQIRANVGDGGVDASVAIAIPNAKSGWFEAPTCWQYKSSAYKNTDALIKEVEREMEKDFAAERISQGCAYRFCMLESIPESTVVSKIETAMLQKSQVLCSKTAPATPRLVHGGSLSSWAAMYPAVSIRVLGLAGDFQLFSPWLKNQRHVTETYVENPAWSQIAEQLLAHIDFAQSPVGNDTCFSIAGNSGVGKTRLVSETLDLLQAADALVIQTDVGEEALRIASYLSQARHRHAILVVDECSPQTLYELRARLRSFADSVRVVAIEHLDRIPIQPPEQLGHWLSEPGEQTTLEILNRNFPFVSMERRRKYSRISEGFIRFAADLCEHDAEIDIDAMSGSLRSIVDYLASRLGTDRDIDIVASLALFSKIGYRDEVGGELALLSDLTGVPVDEYRQRIKRLRHSPGFVAQRGRYWYITPQIVARSLFGRGWSRFVEPDIARFLGRLTPEHLLQVQSRANAFGGKEVADQLANYFRGEMSRLTIEDLADSRVAQFVAAVAETDLHQFLPVLSNMICASDDEQLACLDRPSNSTSWRSRRYMIWLFEKAALFAEFFSDAERALLRLAQYETEPQIGNNATRVWAELFRIRSSATAMNFGDRLAILHRHLSDMPQSELVSRAIKEALGRPGLRAAPIEFFASCGVPQMWRPQSLAEERRCLSQTLLMCGEFSSAKSGKFDDHLFTAIYESLSWLINRGIGEEARGVLTRSRLSDSQRRRLYNFLAERMRANGGSSSQCSEDVLAPLQSWAQELAPRSLGERMRSLISCGAWDERFRPELRGERGELTQIAEEFIARPQLLRDEFNWLDSDEAQSTRGLGHALGKLDLHASLADVVCRDAKSRKQARLLVGYVAGILTRSSAVPAVVDETVAYFCDEQPAAALELLQTGGEAVDGAKRLCTLIQNDRVAPCQTLGIAHHFGQSTLSVEQFEAILQVLVGKAMAADETQRQCVVRFVSLFEEMHAPSQTKPSLFDSPNLAERIVQVLGMTKDGVSGRIASEWTSLAKSAIDSGRDDVFAMFRALLFSSDGRVITEALSKLSALASDHSGKVIDVFGDALFDRPGVLLPANECRDLISAIDEDDVLNWLKRKGSDAAEAIARHLPQPYVDENGRFVVPALLDRILQRYGTDAVLAELHAGLNSGEMIWGDLAPVLHERAERFKLLFDHTNPAIRRFAREEAAYLTNWAKSEQLQEEEDAIAH